MILTIQQRQALDSYVELAWGTGTWEDFPATRQSAIAWALAGVDEEYARAIIKYLGKAWALKLEQAR